MIQYLKSLNNLTEAEESVRDYIVENPSTVLELSISELAKRTNVGIATINRFATKLGFKGFKDFKIEYAKQFKDAEKVNAQSCEQPFTFSSSIDEVLEKLPIQYQKILEFTASAMDKTVLNRTVQNILTHKLIIFGTGVNHKIADCFVYKLEELGIDAKSSDSFHYQYVDYLTSQNIPCYAIVITHSGRNTAMLTILKKLRKRKIPTLLICSLNVKPELLQNCTDIMYTIPTGNTADLSNIYFSISLQFIFDVLYCLLLVKKMNVVKQVAEDSGYYSEEQDNEL